jgi:hypothetical protein
MFALLFRILWQYYPSLWACALFWTVVGISEYRFIQWKKRKYGWINWWTRVPILMGASMNAIVTLVNNGRMPVLGATKLASVWVQGNGKHLLFLCDRFPIHGLVFSLGDFFLIGGVIATLIFSERRQHVGSSTQSDD